MKTLQTLLTALKTRWPLFRKWLQIGLITLSLPVVYVLIFIITTLQTIWKDGLKWLFHNLKGDLGLIWPAYMMNFKK